MEYLRGETVYFSFPVQDGTGARKTADAPPNLTVYVDNVDRTSFWTDIAAVEGDIGEYNGTVTVPNNIADDAIVVIKIRVIVGGITSPKIQAEGGRFRVVRFRSQQATLNRMSRVKVGGHWFVRLWDKGASAILFQKRLLDWEGFAVNDLPDGVLAIEEENTVT
jgi:hypothetical protein